MIYAHNKGITGINVHNFPTERVYKGSRLVWLRDSTDDHFTIVGDPFIIEGYNKTFRIRYYGSDDISYTWSFNNIDPGNLTVSYNHNHKKATLNVMSSSGAEYIDIVVLMQRSDKEPLIATKRIEVISSCALRSFSIDDVYYYLSDSSVYVPFNVVPSECRDVYEVYSASIDDNRLGVTNMSGFGLDIYKQSQVYSPFNTILRVSLLDGFIIPDEDLPDFDNIEIVSTISEASGNYNEIYVTSTGKYYELNNLGQYEEYGIMPVVSSLSNLTYYPGKLAIMNGHEYKWNGFEWYDLGELVYSHNIASLSYSGNGYVVIQFNHHWGKNWKCILTYSFDRVIQTGPSISYNKEEYLIYNYTPDTPTSSRCTTPLGYYMKCYPKNGQLQFYSTHSLVDEKSPSDPYLNEHNFISTTKLIDYPGRIINADMRYNYHAWSLYEDGTVIDSGYKMEDIDGWYDGMYRARLTIDSSFGTHFMGLSIYDEDDNLIHDIKPKYNPDADSSANIVSIYDSVIDAEYFNVNDTIPEYTMVGYGEKIPTEYYKKKYSINDLVETEDGWKLKHDASANVYAYNPTRSFTINGQDAGEGFDPKGRIQLGFNIPKVIKNVNIYGKWYMETPPVYGLYKVHAEEERYYCTWGLEQMSHDMHNGWVQYNDGEHPFIPPVISSYDSVVKTWFRYDMYKADNVYAGGGTLDLTDASLQEYNVNLERKYQTMIFNVSNPSYGGDWTITMSSSSSYIYP